MDAHQILTRLLSTATARAQKFEKDSVIAGEHRGPMDGRWATILPTDSAEEAKKGGEAFGKANVVTSTAILVGDLRFLFKEQKCAQSSPGIFLTSLRRLSF